MRILVTGASGLVGQAFCRHAAAHDVVRAVHHRSVAGAVAFSLEDPKSVRRLVAASRPDWIVHAAAMARPDECERSPERAWSVNALGAERLAQAAAGAGARMVLLSTDHVFDGLAGPYEESDEPRPLSVYGRSKLAAEGLARAALPGLVVARTALVFGREGPSFVRTVEERLREGLPCPVAADQIVTPTWSADLAQQLLALIEGDAEGVFHTAGATALSRAEMAAEVARAFGLDPGPLRVVQAADLPWIAPRPLRTPLATAKIRTLKPPLAFRDALLRHRSDVAAGPARVGPGAA